MENKAAVWRASLKPGVHAVDPAGSSSFYCSQEPPVSSQSLMAVSSQAPGRLLAHLSRSLRMMESHSLGNTSDMNPFMG